MKAGPNRAVRRGDRSPLTPNVLHRCTPLVLLEASPRPRTCQFARESPNTNTQDVRVRVTDCSFAPCSVGNQRHSAATAYAGPACFRRPSHPQHLAGFSTSAGIFQPSETAAHELLSARMSSAVPGGVELADSSAITFDARGAACISQATRLQCSSRGYVQMRHSGTLV